MKFLNSSLIFIYSFYFAIKLVYNYQSKIYIHYILSCATQAPVKIQNIIITSGSSLMPFSINFPFSTLWLPLLWLFSPPLLLEFQVKEIIALVLPVRPFFFSQHVFELICVVVCISNVLFFIANHINTWVCLLIIILINTRFFQILAITNKAAIHII